MLRARLVVLSLFASSVILACGESTPSEPAAAANQVAKTSPTDTTKPPPSSFNLTGKILGVQAVAGQGNDTLRFTPISGAQVKLVRNVLVDGKPTQLPVGEITSSSTGAYQFSNLPGGYYVVYATPPAGSPYAANWSYIAGTYATVDVNVFLWLAR